MSKAKEVLEKLVPIIEMATVGSHAGYKITVYTEPQLNPSFHVTYKKDFEIVLQMNNFKILEVKFGSFTKGEMPSNKILKDLKAFFKQKSKKSKSGSNWDALVFSWNILNDQELSLEMPKT